MPNSSAPTGSAGPSGDGESIGLAEAIAEVRKELAAAELEGEDSEWRFRVNNVSLEFAVELRRVREGSGGLRLGVVQAGVAGTTESGATHRVQLDLSPHGKAADRPVGRPRQGR